MNLKEAYEKFDFKDVSILIIDSEGEAVSVSEANSSGGYCSCCSDGSINDECTVVRVVDLSEMKILYSGDSNNG